jgi:hypothetical protein
MSGAGGSTISDRIPEIETCPIYYLSTHGLYEIDQYKKGVPLEITVPDDMIVIETSNIGESCYFINFKEIMEPLLNDRNRFLQYLSGNPPDDDSLELQFKRAGALNSCHIYLPTMHIANRLLTLETGSRAGVHPVNQGERMEGARTSSYQHMIFRRYDIGKQPVPVLEHVHAQLIEESHGHHHPTSKRANAWIKGEATETYENMFNHISKSAKASGITGLKIVIFPSCGTIFLTKPKKGMKVDEEEINTIIKLQTTADIIWSGFIGKSLKNVYDTLDGIYKGSKGVHMEAATQVVGANKYPATKLPKHHAPPPLPPSQMNLRSKGSKGGKFKGTRKFKRKFKRSLKKKTRKTL